MPDGVLARRTLVIILAGGQGERLYPLTRDRAKPAVPFGGIYRIIDFTLSNCLNSGLRRIYVLTQYKSISLNRHLRLAWDVFHEELGECIVPIPPQQRSGQRWYQGTADALYQNIYTLERERPELVFILAGDHIYKMNYLAMLHFHLEHDADVTVGCVEAPLADGHRFGILSVAGDGRIKDFQEKPEAPTALPNDPKRCLASMGVYVFRTETLVQTVAEDAKRESSHDFGRDILPRMVKTLRVYAHAFQDENRKPQKYWRDIGTLDAYYQANMDLVAVDPVFNLYDKNWPIRTHQNQYPPAKTVLADEDSGRVGTMLDSLVSHGCIISGGRVERSVLSPGVRVDAFAEVTDSILMDDAVVGEHARVRGAIVDKGVVIASRGHVGCHPDADRKRFTVTQGGVVVVPKDVPHSEGFWRRR